MQYRYDNSFRHDKAVQLRRSAGMVILAAATMAAAPAPRTTKESAERSAASAPAVRTKFEAGDAINDYFTALSVRFGVTIVQPKPVKAFILKPFELPEKLDDALDIGQNMLEAQGLSIHKSVFETMVVLRVIPIEDARKAELLESPVTSGSEPEKIDISKPNRVVTHLLQVNHPDMAEDLKREAGKVKQVQVDLTGEADTGITLILSGPAKQVQEAVDNIVKIDKSDAANTAKLVARTMQLHNLRASELAESLNTAFASQTVPLKAVVDQRTNSIIVTGPEDKVLDVMVNIVGMEMAGVRAPGSATPAAPPAPPAAPVPAQGKP